jgi:hypothetical protein
MAANNPTEWTSGYAKKVFSSCKAAKKPLIPCNFRKILEIEG